jgi:pimeloyl-ACP methyl ester carboxylesterase
MPFTTINGIKTHYLIQGSGPHLLLFAPGGFRSIISRWTAEGGKGVFKDMNALETLSKRFTVIAYDRRESGLSGGRIEPLSWDLYVQEAKAMLDLAGAKQAYVLGGCMGASLAMALAARHPGMCKGLLLHWPVAGYRWTTTMHAWFQRHIDFVRAHGFDAVVARSPKGDNFFLDPEIGPWGSPTVVDPAFAAQFVKQDLDAYIRIVEQSRDNLFGDTMPSGVSGAELMQIQVPALIMSGADWAHALSGSWAIKELMPHAQLWDVLPPEQNAQNTLEQILRFTEKLEAQA